MYYILSDDVFIAIGDYNPHGQKTIMLLHGWPLNSRIFEYQIDVLPSLGYRVITMDIRGFGLSQSTYDGYDYNQLAKDLYNVIQTLNLSNIILAGFSMGGAIAVRYMSIYKEYAVSKLVLMAATVPSLTRTETFPYGMTKEALNVLIALAYTDRPVMVSKFTDMLFAFTPSDEFRNWMRLLALSSSGLGTSNCAKTLRDEDLKADLPNIHVPTGIFHGKLDNICPYEFAEYMHTHIKGSQLFPFQISGHFVIYEELELFNQRFISFISQ